LGGLQKHLNTFHHHICFREPQEPCQLFGLPATFEHEHTNFNDLDIASRPDSPIWQLSSSLPPPLSVEDGLTTLYHPLLNGTPCNIHGNDLPPDTPPPSSPEDTNVFFPFKHLEEFEFAKFLFIEEQMSGKKTDKLMMLLAALYDGYEPPFADHQDLHSVLNAIPHGNISLQSFSVNYDGPLPLDGEVPTWMTTEYDVWFHNPLLVMEQQIGNHDYTNEFDFHPKQVFDKAGKCQYTDLMSGNWAWGQAVRKNSMPIIFNTNSL
jgi:hypothetical protein